MKDLFNYMVKKCNKGGVDKIHDFSYFKLGIISKRW